MPSFDLLRDVSQDLSQDVQNPISRPLCRRRLIRSTRESIQTRFARILEEPSSIPTDYSVPTDAFVPTGNTALTEAIPTSTFTSEDQSH
ncbi:hypothetical protein Syun_007396 [Stephania yunnanensis]|uniref:Uncharacterized protein n=1 Tax=Stephania yunnanensis TaxID=152371 RepID=A0AAP0L106_9MAGN